MTSQLLTDLRAARALIEDPAHFTTKASARAADGRIVSVTDASACAWCAAGALQRTVPAFESERYNAANKALHDAAPDGFGYVEVNDRDGHAAVLALYDRAIAAAEGKS